MRESRVRELTQDTFHETVQKELVLVDFFADWCGPCRTLAPVLEKVADELRGQVVIAKLDIDHAQQIAASLQVTSIPTMILFKESKEVGRIVGLSDLDGIKRFVLGQ